MSEGQSQLSVASSSQHWQEAEVVAAEERERAAAETAAMATRALRLAMAELAATMAEVEASAALSQPTTAPMMSSSWRGRQRESRWRSGQPRTSRGVVAAAQTGVDAPAAGSMEIATFTGGVALPPRTSTIVTMGSRPLSGTSVPMAGGLPSPRPTTSSEPR
jgi:hypothetical protein